jgi:hypothetical protein
MKDKGRRRGSGSGRDQGKGFLRTDAHSRQDKVVGHPTTDRVERLGLQKVDPAQRGVARLQTAKERPFHRVHIVREKHLRCLLCRALRLARVFVLASGARSRRDTSWVIHV